MSNKNYLIPLEIFLNKLNLSVEEYFQLPNVPFPIVSADGEVIYQKYDRYFYSDRRGADPKNRGVSLVNATRLLNFNTKYYIDIRIFDPKKYGYQERAIYRKPNLTIDLSRIRKGEEHFQTEPLESIEKILHYLLNGKERIATKPNHLLSHNYEFSDLDLINDENESFLFNFNSSNYTLVYDTETKCLLFNPVISQPTQGNTMSTRAESNKVSSSILDSNKNAIIAATKLEVGGLALDLITDQIVKGIPESFRPLIAGNPLFKIAVANAVNLLVLQTNIDDPKLLILNDAMMTKSYSSMLESFDLTSLLSTVLTQIPAGKLKTLTGNE